MPIVGVEKGTLIGMKREKVIIAHILQALIDGGVKLESPYDVENWITDYLTHNAMLPFFYDREYGNGIDLREAISKELKKEQAAYELKELEDDRKFIEKAKKSV